ncbi:unnamed protein product [Angiostrongylus costaricensis]|uniref:VWFA domain-containing protein n=1 Tax=Angiostrongylus costaricensis TaxID=334426 RepID=A0A0R3PCB5_ANGCS|nr:unnamed protein product [Angiostrongylus costaricensis]
MLLSPLLSCSAKRNALGRSDPSGLLDDTDSSSSLDAVQAVRVAFYEIFKEGLNCNLGFGPPGVQPPATFEAEQWYPSNLPTVAPPWKKVGFDFNTFGEESFVQFNSTSSSVGDQNDGALYPNCSDIFFVLDSSGNVVEQYEKQKTFINNMLVMLEDKDRHYGLMTYASKRRQRINVPIKLQISKQLFMKKLARARFLSGVTATGAALRAVESLKFPRRTDVIVVTDGFSFDSVRTEAERLREVLGDIAGDDEHILLGNPSTQRLLDLLKC